MKAYTDYPIASNLQSEVIEVEMLTYDRDKYVTVKHGDCVEDIKRGYLFKDPKLTQRITKLTWCLLPEDGDELKSRREAYCELKQNRAKSVEYTVYHQSHGEFKFDALLKALKKFNSFTDREGWAIHRVETTSCGFKSETILEKTNGTIYICGGRNDYFLRKRHLLKKCYGIPE